MEIGLLWINPLTEEYAPIPLKSVDIEASVLHAIAQVEITQVYSNSEANPIEAVYIFPVDSNGAVTHFHAEVDGRVIKGVVKSNSEAEKDYEAAKANKKTAFLGEEVMPDVFKLKVGFLKPGSTAKVVIGYVTEVKNVPDSHAMRFFIPTTVAPRYVPVRNPHNTRSRKLENSTFSETSPAPLSIKTIACVQGGIDSVISPSHKINVEMKGQVPDKPTWSKAVVTLTGNMTDMDRDYVIVVAPTVIPSLPKIYSETLQDGSVGLMAHLIPSFALKEEKVELIVVVDRSGSMQGESIKMAGLALQLFLRSLPTDCFFNVVGFGFTHHSLFPEGSKRYGHEAFLQADNYAKRLTADLGGTEILDPLEEIYERPSVPGYIRQLFVITDGEVSNTDEVIRLVKTNSITTRLFSVGVGRSCSHYLVEGIAKAGSGTSAFVSNADDIPKVIMSQLKNAMQPCMKDIQVEWIGMEPSVPSDLNLNKDKTLIGSEQTPRFLQSPNRIPPIFDGSQMTIFGICPPGLKAPSALKITATSPDGPLSFELNINQDIDIGNMTMIHKMGTVKLIREMEMDELGPSVNSMEDKIVSLGTQFGITSKYTSYIAVDDSDDTTVYSADMKTRQVPSQHGKQRKQLVYKPGRKSSRCRGRSVSAPRKRKRAARKSIGGRVPCRRRVSDDSDDSDDAVRKRKRGVRKSAPRKQLASKAAKKGAPSTRRVSDDSSDSDDSDVAPRKRKRAARKSVPRKQMASKAARKGDSSDSDDLDSGDDSESEKKTGSEFKNASGIICFQNFDGSFELSAKLCAAMNQNFTAIKKESHTNRWDDRVWATALVVSFLREKFTSQINLWELCVKKAEAWISTKCVDEELVKRIFSKARSIFSK